MNSAPDTQDRRWFITWISLTAIFLLVGLVVPYFIPPISEDLGVGGSMLAIYGAMFGGPVFAFAAVVAAFSGRSRHYRAAWGAVLGVVLGASGVLLEVLLLKSAYLGLLWLPIGIITGWLIGSRFDRR